MYYLHVTNHTAALDMLDKQNQILKGSRRPETVYLDNFNRESYTDFQQFNLSTKWGIWTSKTVERVYNAKAAE